MRKSTKPTLSARVRLALLALPAAFASVALSSCNKHVFEVVPRDCTAQQDIDKPIPVDTPADILIVVDNSGSMCEEQANLVENFFDENCPITDLNNIPEQYRNPDPAMVQELAKNCGFVQLLAAYDNDWRLGVITTDVGQCDNRFGFASLSDPIANCSGTPMPDWGRRPQRGCLQPDNGGTKVLKRGDQDVGRRFREILNNVRTFGSAWERGLDAMQVFLSPNSDRAPGCENDLDLFLRPEAKLVVIFLTDEDDCSHADGAFGLLDENDGESCSNATEVFHVQRTPVLKPEECYEKWDQLAPTSRYSQFLKSYKGDPKLVSVAVIAGGLFDEDSGAVIAGGCTVSNDGVPQGGCFESGGNSHQTAPGYMCDPDQTTCCTADPGTRYFQFARELGASQFLNDSICFDSFRNTMINIAAFIAADDFVQLAERPASPGAIVVEITRAGENEPTPIPRIPDGEDPSGRDGWQYDSENLRVVFYGDAKPKPGDTIQVDALANRGEEQSGCVESSGSAPADDAGTN